MSMRMRPILYDKGYREVIGSDIHAGEQNVKAAVGTSAAKGNFVRKADPRRQRANGSKVRSADLWPTKTLHNVLNGCFGEAALQHLDIWPKSAVGRSRR